MKRFTGVMLLPAVAMILAGATSAMAGDNGVVKGKVIFDGDKGQFKRKKLKTEKDPKCKQIKPKGIGSYDVILNKKTDPITVRNVLVSVKSGLSGGDWPVPGEPVVIMQKGCEYHPHVFGIMEGQKLKIVNGDSTNHNIHFLPKVNDEMNFSQPKKGMEKLVELVKEGTFPMKCDVHPWMKAYCQVFDHPFFTVTGKDGTFEIPNLPAGKYVIEAWHETFGTLTFDVEVATGQTVEKDFTFSPK